MAGMFRGGHRRPTFDTEVEFVAVNQTAPDRSGGYGAIQVTRGPWGAPEVLAEQTIASGERDDFEPTGDSGVQATNLGMFAWFTAGGIQTLMFQENSTRRGYRKTRVENGNWSDWDEISNSDIEDVSANRNRLPLPNPVFITIAGSPNSNIAKGLPPISYAGTRRVGIVIDDATGQSLYYCNNRLSPPRCEHYRRAIDDGTGPASRTYMADVKDIASAERVIGDVAVATRTKSLVFAHATLKPLLEAEGSIAKDWKVRIGGRDMDITQVMDGWVPNQYTRLVVEDRS